MILIAFENSMFPLPPQHPLCIHGCKDDDMDSSEFMSQERESSIPLSFQHKNMGGNIAEKEKRINNVLLRDYFKYQSPSYMYESLRKKIKKKKKEIEKITERNKIQVDLIKSALIKWMIWSKICLRIKKELKSQMKQ